MAGVFQNVDPHPPHRPASVYPPPLVRGEDTLAGWRRGWGVNILKDVRHISVLYVCKYFVCLGYTNTHRNSRSIGSASQRRGGHSPRDNSHQPLLFRNERARRRRRI
jgi:hypothetical protein